MLMQRERDSENLMTNSVEQTQDSQENVLDHVAGKPQLAFAQLMPRVAAEHGKALAGQMKDILRLCMRGNKLSVDEYYTMRLFDAKRYSLEDQKTFVGLQKSREIWTTLGKSNRFMGLVDDKLAFEKMLSGFGIATPQTQAIVGGHYPDTVLTKIKDSSELKAYLSGASFPVFGKPVNSTQSLGSARLEGFDAASDTIQLSGGKSLTLDRFWSEIESSFGGQYLFQACLEPHPMMKAMCGSGLPTVRIVTIDRGKGAEVYRCAAKLTTEGNVADNFWRAGNLLAPVDPETGVMSKALTQMGIDGEFVSHHPASGAAIEGETVPHWDEAVTLAKQVMGLLSGVSLLGFDVAITDKGPVIIEANNDPHMIMMQVAHQKGVLDKPMLEALEHASRSKAQKAAKLKAQLANEREATKEDMRKAVSTKQAA